MVNPEENTVVSNPEFPETREIWRQMPESPPSSLRMGGSPTDFFVDPSLDTLVELPKFKIETPGSGDAINLNHASEYMRGLARY